MLNRIYTYACLALLSACNNIPTDVLLKAEFVTAGQPQIQLLSPLHETATTAYPVFIWSERIGASRYRIEVSDRADFQKALLDKIVTGSTYTLKGEELAAGSAIEGKSLYWRVSVPYISNNLLSSVSRVHLLHPTTTYVDSASTSVEIGNLSFPFRRIQTAIDTVNTRRAGNADKPANIQVAAGTYNETVYLRPNISLRGGYSRETWTYNPTTSVTTIAAETHVGVVGDSSITTAYTAGTIIEGFTILGGSITNVDSIGIDLDSANVWVKNNIITGRAISLSKATVGIWIRGGKPRIHDNIITAGTNFVTQAIGIVLSSPLGADISRNTIFSGNANSQTGISVGAIGTGGDFTLIANNVIRLGNAFSSSRGVNLGSGTVKAWIVNNTIDGGTSTTAKGIDAGSTAPGVTLANNIVYTRGGTTRYCIAESSTGILDSFENNALFDCGTALYLDAGVNVRNAEVDLNTPSLTIGAGKPSQGNIATGLSYVASQFFSVTDQHLTALTPINLRCGGKDVTLNTCGATANASCGNVTDDLAKVLRTASLAGNCTTPSNPGASGYSIGAYELD